jgi:hypothetical protein
MVLDGEVAILPWGEVLPPLFGGPAHGLMRRFPTWEDAARGHNETVQWLLNGGRLDVIDKQGE